MLKILLNHLWPSLLLSSLVVTSAQATDWFVATDGSNQVSCGTSGSPCQTISYTLANKVRGSDSVKIRAGNYEENIVLDNPTNHGLLTVTAENVNSKPQLNGTIDVKSGVASVTISHLKIRGAAAPSSSWWWVVMLRGQGGTLDNNEIWNGGTCIYIRSSGRNTRIINNHIHHCGVWGEDDSHAINLVNNNRDPLPASWDEKLYIYNNTIHDGGGDGFQDSYGQDSGSASKYIEIAGNDIYGWDEDAMDFKGSQYVRIHHNKLHHNGGREWGNGINTQDTYALGGDYEIWDNQIYNNWGSAIYQKWGAPRMKAWNNLIFDNSNQPQYNSFAVISEAGCSLEFYHNVLVNNNATNGLRVGGIQSLCANNIYRNNILYNNGVCSGCYGNIISNSGEGLGTFSNNYVYPASPGQVGTSSVSTCFEPGNCPGFTNLSSKDFRLQQTSPAVDKGQALGTQFSLDYQGNNRPLAGLWDIGAFENISNSGPLTQPQGLRITP